MPKTVLQKIKTSGKEFNAPKHGSHLHSKELSIIFDDTKEIEVELLSIDDLPATFKGNIVNWMNNFAVKKNGKYLQKTDNIKYTIHFDPIPADTIFVYYDGQNFHEDIQPVPSERPGKTKISLMLGDPGTGWVKPS